MFRKLAGLTAVAGLFIAGSAVAGTIVGSAHDFSDNGTWSNGEICVVCHTPHNAAGTDGPLWNRANYTPAGFTMYPSGGTIQGTIDPQPTGTSSICLSCHEGSLNVDSFGGGPATPSVVVGDLNPAAVVGLVLSNDHPISITYSATDLELADTGNGIIFGNLDTGTVADLLDTGSKVQCSSCHDVHNTQTVDGAPNLLRIANDSTNGSASGLCLTCHEK